MMLYPIDSFTFTHNGRSFTAELHYDENHGAPWEEEDGHGPVSDWELRNKRPGEVIIAESEGFKRFYDFAEACRIARKDGWDVYPYRTGTKRQIAARAARADMERMKAWCNDEWCYMGVIVREKGACRCCGERESLWGLESDFRDELKQVAQELAEELTARLP